MKVLFSKLVPCLLAALTLTAPVLAQDAYPNRPIRIIVPFPPGGGSDTVTRLVAAKLTETWKVPVLVENRPGGNTVIAAEAAAKAPADGYTLFTAIDSTLAMNQHLYAKLPYDPINGFAPVTQAVSMPMVLALNPGVDAKNVKELIALAKAKGGQFAYAHGALPAQVAGEVFKSMVKVDMLPVPYKGSAPAMMDTIGGTVPAIFDALGPAMQHIKAGKVKALAVTSRQRSAALPNVPTMAEAGLPGFDIVTWIGFLAPAGTKERLADLGMDVVASTPQQFAQTIKDDAVKFGRIIKSAGIKLD